MLNNTTLELTFTGAVHLVPQPAQIAPETCPHPDVFCPSSYSLIDHVANMCCPLCNAKVDTDVSTCLESCTERNKPADNSDHDFDSIYLPSADGHEETLEQLNRPCPLMADSPSGTEGTGEPIDAVEAAPVRPWRQLDLTETFF